MKKVIIKGKRYSLDSAKLVLRLQHSRDHVENLWQLKNGTWIIEIEASLAYEKTKTGLALLSEEEVFEYLEAAQFASPAAYSENMDSQKVVKILEHYFAAKNSRRIMLGLLDISLLNFVGICLQQAYVQSIIN